MVLRRNIAGAENRPLGLWSQLMREESPKSSLCLPGHMQIALTSPGQSSALSKPYGTASGLGWEAPAIPMG